MEGRNIVLLFVSTGALFGIGSGLTFISPVVCGYRWLPNHKVRLAFVNPTFRIIADFVLIWLFIRDS